ncbi:hypothetical protein [Streptomyces hebeiensis]
MVWDEWEQAKAGGGGGGPAGTRLNQLASNRSGGNSGSGGGQRDLIVHDDELGKLGDMARTLREQMANDGDHARVATFDASTELFNDGLDMGAGLLELHNAWNTKLATLKEACAHISNHLDYSRSSHAKQEQKIVTDMRDADGNTMTVSRIYDQIR